MIRSPRKEFWAKLTQTLMRLHTVFELITEPSTGLPAFTTTAVTTITATMTSADLVEGQVKNLN